MENEMLLKSHSVYFRVKIGPMRTYFLHLVAKFHQLHNKKSGEKKKYEVLKYLRTELNKATLSRHIYCLAFLTNDTAL